jgi:hypothetical protein
MKEIPLDSIPNQSLSVVLDGDLYDLIIKETNGTMSVTIRCNNETILDNSRIVAGTPLIPFPYLERGNFMLLTLNEEYPYYTQFGITQTLIYASQTELEAIRGT